ncbi:MAG: hypothetical protein HKL79_00955 [Thermoplasmata archaeon]|nr:hypothetical protein [Thermoplasmata archaeon]
MIAIGLAFYLALGLLLAAGYQVPLTWGPLSLFVLVAVLFFAHVHSRSKLNRNRREF